VFPGQVEQCDGIDNDCDGQLDGLRVPAGGYATIGDAIADASHGDLVCVASGTYNERIDFGGLEIRVRSESGPTSTTISGAGLSGPVVTFASAEGSDAVLRGFTIYDGEASNGGGLYVDGASPTLSTLLLMANSASGDGGGLYVTGNASPTLDAVHFISNTASGSGGGAYVTDGSILLANDVSFSEGQAGAHGGGLALVDAQLSGTGVGFDTNVARDPSGTTAPHGGGLYAQDAEVELSMSYWMANEADGSGGGLHASGGTSLQMVGVGLLMNVAGEDGGGAWIDGGSSTWTHVLFALNQSTHDGGGLYGSGVDPVITQGLFWGNSGSGGGGLFLDAGHLETVNTIVSDNEAAVGGGIQLAGGATADITYCDFFANTGGDVHGMASPVGTSGNLGLDPEYQDLDPQNDGFDYHLAVTSPLIDMGDPTILDPDSSVSDMGCYGGPAAGDMDFDGDGYFGWWQPGPYDHATYPALGWDCDDHEANTYPGNGC